MSKEEEYEFRSTGIRRHPELYKETEVMSKEVFSTIEEEKHMWDLAEKIDGMLKGFTVPQRFFIWHYVNALYGMDTLEELKWMEWLKFRAYCARYDDIKKRISESGILQ